MDNGTNINWVHLKPDTLKVYLQHLDVSDSRCFVYRCFYRHVRPFVRKLGFVYRFLYRQLRRWGRYLARPERAGRP